MTEAVKDSPAIKENKEFEEICFPMGTWVWPLFDPPGPLSVDTIATRTSGRDRNLTNYQTRPGEYLSMARRKVYPLVGEDSVIFSTYAKNERKVPENLKARKVRLPL